jgi:hypothetical protein
VVILLEADDRFVLKMWLKADGFVEPVKQWWESQFHGTPSYILAKKLKTLKLDLKKWNEEVFGIVEFKRRQLLKGLNELDTLEETHPLSAEEKS